MPQIPPPTTAALAGLRLALVGAGRVGTSLASWAVQCGARLVAVASRSEGSRQRAAGLLATERVTPIAALDAGDCDLLLLAVSDAALDATVATLAGRPLPGVVLHGSGSRDAESLAALRNAGTAVGSLHPLRAFPTLLPALTAASGVVFGVDGDPAAIAMTHRLATAFGGVAAEIPPRARLLYHYAATLAAGGVVGLLATADSLRRRLGLPATVTTGYLELARGAVEAASRSTEPTRALTGPLARGDADLVHRQLAALHQVAPEIAPLGLELARTVLALLLEDGARDNPLRPAQEALAIELAAVETNRSLP